MIKNIIFDIGGIIITEKEAHAFAHLTIQEQDEVNKLVFYNPRFSDVLLGNITTKDYMNELLSKNTKYHSEIKELLDKDMQDQFIPKNQDIVDLIYKLNKKYNIYFLSNMIDITYDYLSDFLSDFAGGVYSYQEHTKKPNHDFYLRLIEKYNIDLNETIFFDDREKNVLAAEELGIKSYVYKSIEDIINALNN